MMLRPTLGCSAESAFQGFILLVFRPLHAKQCNAAHYNSRGKIQKAASPYDAKKRKFYRADQTPQGEAPAEQALSDSLEGGTQVMCQACQSRSRQKTWLKSTQTPPEGTRKVPG